MSIYLQWDCTYIPTVRLGILIYSYISLSINFFVLQLTLLHHLFLPLTYPQLSALYLDDHIIFLFIGSSMKIAFIITHQENYQPPWVNHMYTNFHTITINTLLILGQSFKCCHRRLFSCPLNSVMCTFFPLCCMFTFPLYLITLIKQMFAVC